MSNKQQQRKWNPSEILKFLDLFKEFDVLYNITHKDYLNKPLKTTKMQNLLQLINDNGK